MIKWSFFLTLTGLGILALPWPLPHSYLDYVGMMIGYILLIAPGFTLVVAVLNRLVNISFTTNPEDKLK